MSFCNKLKPKSAATSARQTPVAAGASATRCFTIKPDARTSERWSRDECYPANLVLSRTVGLSVCASERRWESLGGSQH